mmetsp:Transcript_16579/g.24940  ORF Transcript_16579/g.24940 Transcript_16579/m.24940 type:complete len:377 (-) Transcript_16579:214-1344(-)|eukprot:CAMPEP_0185039522 /NCGR_PEP_ID=MMETSP1103-20130426/36444_1 /TAXON_ID=36769 /ORGANISM="Paraphysomonas bandaiensis, Strain Caron Lab Isolate" /LENGTH=376 /DNA_ID=CAMNT_0027578439 /DNA_START=90 /DNA_END=1220 /DNA_ORIENTATION=-
METTRRRGRSFIDEDDSDTNPSVSQPQSESSDSGPVPYDPSITFEDDSDEPADEIDHLTEENEEEYFSRGRSRSRSVHEGDDTKIKVLSEEEIQKQMAKCKQSSSERSCSVEKSGPLQHREVVALQQGLKEATHQRRVSEQREEQAELEAAMREKEQRSVSTSGHATTSAVQIGSDPPMRRVKILLLGDTNVGKTSIISRLTTGDFRPQLVSTVGVDYKVKKINLDSEPIQVQLWDTAGSERFHQITTSYYRGVNGIMLCFDVSVRDTFERVTHWIHNIKKYSNDNVQVLLVGNKIDLRDGDNAPDCVSEKEVKQLANKFGVPYAETSALTADNVESALQSIVRAIVQVDDGTSSPIRKSVDAVLRRDKKEKCVVS